MKVKIEFISAKLKNIQMKKYLFIIGLLLFTFVVQAQKKNERQSNETKENKKAKQTELVKQLIENKSFTFEPINAITRDKIVINLTNYFMVKIEDDQIFAYLPYYAPTDKNVLKIDDSPFYFKNSISKYELEEKENHYKLNVETVYNETTYFFSFRILKLGHASVAAANSHRQCIFFKGIITKTEEFQATR